MCLFQRSMKYLSQFSSYFFIALSQTTRGKRRKSRRIYHKKIVKKVFFPFFCESGTTGQKSTIRKNQLVKSIGSAPLILLFSFFSVSLFLSFFFRSIGGGEQDEEMTAFQKAPNFRRREEEKNPSPLRASKSPAKKGREKNPHWALIFLFFSLLLLLPPFSFLRRPIPFRHNWRREKVRFNFFFSSPLHPDKSRASFFFLNFVSELSCHHRYLFLSLLSALWSAQLAK